MGWVSIGDRVGWVSIGMKWGWEERERVFWGDLCLLFLLLERMVHLLLLLGGVVRLGY